MSSATASRPSTSRTKWTCAGTKILESTARTSLSPRTWGISFAARARAPCYGTRWGRGSWRYIGPAKNRKPISNFTSVLPFTLLSIATPHFVTVVILVFFIFTVPCWWGVPRGTTAVEFGAIPRTGSSLLGFRSRGLGSEVFSIVSSFVGCSSARRWLFWSSIISAAVVPW